MKINISIFKCVVLKNVLRFTTALIYGASKLGYIFAVIVLPVIPIIHWNITIFRIHETSQTCPGSRYSLWQYMFQRKFDQVSNYLNHYTTRTTMDSQYDF